MIASDEPWVRAPVVSPGAWNRSASIRMQRCSISAVRGYSAWSMKLRCRFSAMIRCASGSIQVVTKVARLRAGSPSRARSSATSRMASSGVMPVSGNSRLGTSWVAKRLPKSTASGIGVRTYVVTGFSFGGRTCIDQMRHSAAGLLVARATVVRTACCQAGQHQDRTEEEADRSKERAGERKLAVDELAGGRAAHSWPARRT